MVVYVHCKQRVQLDGCFGICMLHDDDCRCNDNAWLMSRGLLLICAGVGLAIRSSFRVWEGSETCVTSSSGTG